MSQTSTKSEGTEELLLQSLINDPNKRALMLKLLSQINIPVVPANGNEVDSALNNNILLPQIASGVLSGVVAFIEVCNKVGCDRSGAAKVLMCSLGAVVRDSFTEDVTHVIFKDGSFDTYLKAKQKKLHIVSLLWIEAVRKHNCHVPENDYPALGTSIHDASIKEMLQDYEELLEDELVLTGNQRTHNIVTSNSFPTNSNVFSMSEHLLPISIISSDDNESIVSNGGEKLSSPLSSLTELAIVKSSNSSPDLTSDDDSECAVINGRSAKQSKNCSPIILNCVSSNGESSPESTSLLHTNISNRTANSNIDMDLTDLEENTSNSLIHCKQNTLRASSDTALIKKNSSGNARRSESVPSLRLSDSSKDSSYRNTRSSSRNIVNILSDRSSINDSKGEDHQGSKETLNAHLSPNTKKRAHKAQASNSKKTKMSVIIKPSSKTVGNTSLNSTNTVSANESMPSLHISAGSSKDSLEHINNVVKNNCESATINSDADVSLINRISRLAIQGSPVTHSMSNQILHSDSNLLSSSSPSTSTNINQENITGTPISSDESINRSLLLHNQKTQDIPLQPAHNMRRLYDPNQEVDEVHAQWVEEENRKVCILSKKQLVIPLVPIAPVLFTPNAKKFLKILQKKDSKISNTNNNNTVKAIKKDKAKKKTKNKTVVNNIIIEDENDEQTELANEILNGRRQSVRLLEQYRKSHANRRSTLDFVTTPRMKKQNLFTQNHRNIKPSIVCTRFHNPDVCLFKQIVEKLGKFFVEDEVSKRTTHLVVADCKRTINLLRAIARGCWILKQEWLLQSLEADKWLPEEDFELTDFSPAVQQCRLQREAFGRPFSIDIFENCGPIYITHGSIPRRSDLQELVLLCKGRLSKTAIDAAIVVGEKVRYDVVCVSEQWILDSITRNKRKFYKKYLLK